MNNFFLNVLMLKIIVFLLSASDNFSATYIKQKAILMQNSPFVNSVIPTSSFKQIEN